MRKVVLLCLMVALTIAMAASPNPVAAGTCSDCESTYWVCWINCDTLYWPNDLEQHDRCTANCDHWLRRCLRGCSI